MNPSHHRKTLRVGLLGFGTVGSGTHAVLAKNRATITARAGCAIELAMIATRTPARARDIVGPDIEVMHDPLRTAAHPAIDVVVEAIGGTGAARDCVLEAIAHGKHVVTANKTLLALHGDEIFAAARERGVSVGFEGAVAVSIPIVKALREGLAANEIEWLAGIVNGTSNFVLTRMRDRGDSFDDALREAQALGYAEADPALDVDGGDAAHKLALLAAMAFGGGPRFDAVHVEGIRGLQPADFRHAANLGHTIKLLAVARRGEHGLQLRVHPALIPADGLLARVDGRMNAVVVKGDASGVTMYYGAGAGSRETASAVVADLVDVARAMRQGVRVCVPQLGFHDEAPASSRIEVRAPAQLAQYFRVPAADPGARRDSLEVLARLGMQPIRQVDAAGEMAVLAAPVAEARAAEAARSLAAVCGRVTRLRVEALEAG